MGKIRVQDLASMMGVSQQDLVFKLRSIGVRVEGEEAAVDAEVLQAILAGKKMASPREVIMDDSSPEGAPPAARRTAPAAPARRGARRSTRSAPPGHGPSSRRSSRASRRCPARSPIA